MGRDQNIPQVSAEQFARRLIDLCLRGRLSGLPRRHLDRHILFKSAVLSLDPSAEYTELRLNHALKCYLAEVGAALQDLDHVTLRRYLVDEGYLERNPSGSRYCLGAPRAASLFAPDVEELDVFALLRAGLQQIARRKRLHVQNSSGKPP